MIWKNDAFSKPAENNLKKNLCIDWEKTTYEDVSQI